MPQPNRTRLTPGQREWPSIRHPHPIETATSRGDPIHIARCTRTRRVTGAGVGRALPRPRRRWALLLAGAQLHKIGRFTLGRIFCHTAELADLSTNSQQRRSSSVSHGRQLRWETLDTSPDCSWPTPRRQPPTLLT
jgi:hypothetical protein